MTLFMAAESSIVTDRTFVGVSNKAERRGVLVGNNASRFSAAIMTVAEGWERACSGDDAGIVSPSNKAALLSLSLRKALMLAPLPVLTT